MSSFKGLNCMLCRVQIRARESRFMQISCNFDYYKFCQIKRNFDHSNYSFHAAGNAAVFSLEKGLLQLKFAEMLEKVPPRVTSASL